MSLADAQQRVDAWISQYEEGYFHPLTNLARLTEEVGELAREVNHRFGQKTKKRDEAEGDMAMEMADIVFVLICMANREGIDLQAAFDANPKAKAFFATLDSTNRYAVLFRLQTAKKADTRERRLRQFVEMLERGEKLHPG